MTRVHAPASDGRTHGLSAQAQAPHPGPRGSPQQGDSARNGDTARAFIGRGSLGCPVAGFSLDGCCKEVVMYSNVYSPPAIAATAAGAHPPLLPSTSITPGLYYVHSRSQACVGICQSGSRGWTPSQRTITAAGHTAVPWPAGSCRAATTAIIGVVPLSQQYLGFMTAVCRLYETVARRAVTGQPQAL